MAVATLYWMGIVSTAHEKQLEEKLNRLEAELMAAKAAEQALRIERQWDLAVEDVTWITDMVEEEMEAGHLRDAAETLLALERVYHETAQHDPSVLDRYAETRLDKIVMPALRLIYNVDDLGGEEVMVGVREQLAQLESQRAEDVLREQQAQPDYDA
jgi:hypothetical protein